MPLINLLRQSPPSSAGESESVSLRPDRRPNPYSRRILPARLAASNALGVLESLSSPRSPNAARPPPSFGTSSAESTQSSPADTATASSIFFPVQTSQTETKPVNFVARNRTFGAARATARNSLAAHVAENRAAAEGASPEAVSTYPASTSLGGREGLIASGYSDFKPLGSGSCADVFTAIDTDGITVCVKVNKKDTITAEFEAMKVCDSPRLCKPHSHDARQSPRMMTMEFSNGIPLNDDAAKESFRLASPIQQLAWLKKALSALDSLHSAGYSHNDISFGNILLCPASDGDIDLKIIDFGKASPLEGRSHIGTPYFTSPKAFNTCRQNRGAALRKQNDLYALGMCVVTMFGDWKDIKVGEQRLSDFTNAIKLQRAYKNAMAVGVQAPSIEDVAMPDHLKGIVNKLINLEVEDDVISLRALIDKSIQRLQPLAGLLMPGSPRLATH